VLHSSGERRETGEVATANRSNGDVKQESEGAEQSGNGAAGTQRPIRLTVLRFRLRAVLRRRVRSSRSETLAWSGDGNRPPSLGSFEDLEREISRSRRFGQSFFLARFPRPRRGAEANGWHEPLLAHLSTLVRAVDRVWSDGKDVYLLLPESDRALGTAALARIREPLSHLLSGEELDRIASVVFAPAECPTSRALLSALHGRATDAKTRMPPSAEKVGRSMAEPEGSAG
jgi:hypothetical protein